MSLLFSLSLNHVRLVFTTLLGMESVSRICLNRNFMQHGTTSLYEHCKNVALVSLAFVRRFHLTVDEASLVRGALLHDYYLYDWHDRNSHRRLHGFFHPGIALKNALEDFDLNKTERDIISHHMFPLTPVPPLSKEAWIVCLADKCCSLHETFRLKEVRAGKKSLRSGHLCGFSGTGHHPVS